MRDSQRQKVYDAERAAFGPFTETMTLRDVQALIDRVLASKVIQRRHPRAKYPLVVADGRSRRRGAYKPRWTAGVIAMPKRTRCKWYVLHEIAHHLAFDSTEPWHGWRFCAIYLELVRIYVGRGAEETLKREFKARKVKHREPRTRQMSPEQREAARQRMLAMHAKKKDNQAVAA